MFTDQDTEVTALRQQLARQAEVSRLKDGLLMDAMGKPVRRVLQFDLFEDGPQVGAVVRPLNKLRFSSAPMRIQLLDGVLIEDVTIYLQHVLDKLADYTSEHTTEGAIKLGEFDDVEPRPRRDLAMEPDGE